MRSAGLVVLLTLVVACSSPMSAPMDTQLPKGGSQEDPKVVDISVEVDVPELESATDETGPIGGVKLPEPDREETKGDPPPPPSPPPPPQSITLPTEPAEDGLFLAETPTDGARDDGRKRSKNVGAAAVRSAQGALDPAEVQRAVESAIETFRPCLRTDTIVVLDARVTPEGDVTETKGVSSRPEDTVVRDCVAYAFRKLHLGSTGSVEPSTFRLSLSLKRRG